MSWIFNESRVAAFKRLADSGSEAVQWVAKSAELT